jgi:lysozyme
VVVVAGAALWVRYVWLRDHRPDLRAGERYGIDVSHHQGSIDWDRVAADDIAFAYVKATEGGDHVDARFAENWAGAHAAGLERGAYHFFTLCRPGREQAENFLATVPHDARALPPAVDLELAGNCAARPDRAALDAELGAFLVAVEGATGETVVLYVGDDFEAVYDVRERLGRPLWHRRVLRRPGLDGWWIWQVNGHASVEGIDGDVDLNVMRPGGPGSGSPAPG